MTDLAYDTLSVKIALSDYTSSIKKKDSTIEVNKKTQDLKKLHR